MKDIGVRFSGSVHDISIGICPVNRFIQVVLFLCSSAESVFVVLRQEPAAQIFIIGKIQTGVQDLSYTALQDTPVKISVRTCMDTPRSAYGSVVKQDAGRPAAL